MAKKDRKDKKPEIKPASSKPKSPEIRLIQEGLEISSAKSNNSKRTLEDKAKEK